jgi:pyrroline-5-carboxylate reductase
LAEMCGSLKRLLTMEKTIISVFAGAKFQSYKMITCRQMEKIRRR